MSETMDQAAKQRVKDTLLAQAQEALRALTEQVGQDQAAAEVDPDDVSTVDELSQADEAGDLGGLFERQVARQEALVKQIEALDFGVTETVAPGAIVGFDGARFVVGVVADDFDCDGITYEGISEDSPLYAQIEGLRVGDEFAFGDQTHEIELVA